LAAELPDSTYAVLGLVDNVPGSSGYDLVAVVGRSFAHFWPTSQTLLYRELDRLRDLAPPPGSSRRAHPASGSTGSLRTVAAP
jgi:hypothetical protein